MLSRRKPWIFRRLVSDSLRRGGIGKARRPRRREPLAVAYGCPQVARLTQADDLGLSAGTRADLIQQAEELLRREVGVNTVFPLAIPGVTTAVR